eukprot:gene17154-22668_t
MDPNRLVIIPIDLVNAHTALFPMPFDKAGDTTDIADNSRSTPSSIVIRGHPQAQRLPIGSTKQWNTFTYNILTKSLDVVESDNGLDEIITNGWLNPVTYDKLFIPSDLPSPIVTPALGIVVVHGTPRYIMPSIITALSTADKTWRNRGLCSLPRAISWIDLFAPFVPPLNNIRLSLYAKVMNDVRFLEDQDGITAWTSMIGTSNIQNSLVKFDDEDDTCLEIEPTLLEFKNHLSNLDLTTLDPLRKEGYHFVDVPISDPTVKEGTIKRLYGTTIKGYLSDFTEPQRLLEIEDPDTLDTEPCGELSIELQKVGAGGTSKYLPQVYKDLYEEGNILI